MDPLAVFSMSSASASEDRELRYEACSALSSLLVLVVL